MAKPVHSKTYGSISLSTSSLWSGVIMFRCKLPVKSVENIINKLYQLKLLWCTQGGGGTPLQEPNEDVPLDGVAFSRLE